ncbi:hypothetical protein ACOSQ3_003969 [Xanthoceras sorbifolium]
MPPPSLTSTRPDIFRSINGLVRKAYRTYQKQTLAVLFVLLETISIILDIFGRNTWDVSLASFLLSVFGVVMTLYSAFFIEKGIWNRLTAVEIVFAFTQLIVAYIDLVVKIIRVKINYNYKASAFPLAFSVIVLGYAFKTNKKSPPTHDFSVSSVPKWDGSPPTEPTTDPAESQPSPTWNGSTGQVQARAADSDLPAGSSISVDEIPRRDGFDGVSKDNPDNQDSLKKRKTVPRWTEIVRVNHENQLQIPPDDGYSWRKYGQKDILGAKYPRSYYRCTYRQTKGCSATKQVQRLDDDPTMFEVTYRGVHTCLTPDGSSSSELPKF